MNLSPRTEPSLVLRGAAATAQVSAARLDADLRSNPYVRLDGADPRLVDPGLAKAFDELTASVRGAAETAGYAAGYTSGYAAAVAAVRLEAELAETARAGARQAEGRAIAEVLSSLQRQVSVLVGRQAPLLAELAELVAPASVLLAGVVIGREVSLAESPGLDAVVRVMSSVPDDGDVVVHLHPEDARILAASGAVEQVAPGREIRLLADASIGRGDATADCGDLHVDACLGSALDRAAEVLTP